MSEKPEFKFAVDYLTDAGKARARFTREKHAKSFYKSQKKLGIRGLVFYEINNGTYKSVKMK